MSACETACACTIACLLGLLSGCESKPAFDAPMVLGGEEVPAKALNKGHDLYRLHCASCHGDDGSGRGPAARNLAFSPRDFREARFSFIEGDDLPTHDQLVERIRSGVPERGMPPWMMSDEDLSAVAHYIKTFSPRWREEASP